MTAIKCLNTRFAVLLGLAAFGWVCGAVAQDATGNDQKELQAPAPFIQDGDRNQNPSEGKLKGQTLRIKRPLLMVTDLKRSLDFYENVVGLELYSVDQTYSIDGANVGRKIFNTPEGTRWRLAMLNTSDEVRGLSLREIDADFEVPNGPRVSTVLFEASDILGIRDRAKKAGATVIGPHLAAGVASNGAAEYRFMEMGVIDPDGHVVTFFKYFHDTPEDNAAWESVKE